MTGDATHEDLLTPGFRLDRYELLCPIASGGMASVWLARLRGKLGFEKLFAIKTIKAELVSDRRFQEMFLDEARLASKIVHPNIAQILDLGEQDDVLYTVMEWVDGESLAKVHRVARKRGVALPPGVALRTMADVCAGLQAAHELCDDKGKPLGVVHRDVSPQNILVTSAGVVKVIDFGVAKAKNRIAGDTDGGSVKGKIRYMSPEHVNGAPVDHRADLWAVALCLFELVTGEEPFEGLEDIEVIRKLMGDDPAPSLHGLPESLLPIVPVLSRALVRDPEGRFESAAAMRKALVGAMDELGLAASSEEVAEFLRQHLPDLEKSRRTRVARAIEAAGARERGEAALPSVPTIPVADDVAFAPTMVSDGTPAAPLSSARAPREEPKTTGGATLTEQLARGREGGIRTWLIAGGILSLAIGVFVLRASPTDEAEPAVDRALPTGSAEAPAIAVSGERPALPASTAAPEPVAPGARGASEVVFEPPGDASSLFAARDAGAVDATASDAATSDAAPFGKMPPAVEDAAGPSATSFPTDLLLEEDAAPNEP